MMTKAFVKDTAERAVKTFVQVFVAGFTTQSLTDLSAVKTLALAAAGAALSVVSSALSKRFGNKETASLVA